MTHFRDFTVAEGFSPSSRTVDADAPEQFRIEFVDVVFDLAESTAGALAPEQMHRISSQSMGIHPSGVPYGGFRYAISRDIRGVPWQGVYDLVCRLWPVFAGARGQGGRGSSLGLGPKYREAVNRLLAAHGIAWDLDDHGHLQRVLPANAQVQITSAIRELAAPRFAAAKTIFQMAQDAYDDRPRRDRDACANAFDALEAVAKEVYQRPSDTFGAILGVVRQNQTTNSQVIGILEALNTHRNRNFGHGTTFGLTPAEVDFTYLTCVAGILLLARKA